jgi:hypothetical protein
MTLRNQEESRPRIFEDSEYEHPWYKHAKDSTQLNKPEPPSEEAVKKAQFKDKTYEWRPNARR